jgi:phosphatidylglycerophosphate synthase
MRKIHPEYENPIDHVLLHLCEMVAPWFRRLNVTPNLLTTISNAWAGVCVYAILHREAGVAAVTYWVAYFFDCLDGHYARKYKMVTILGDYYDHISDELKSLVFLVALYLIEPRKTLRYLPVLIAFKIACVIHMYYQEQIYASAEASPTLSILQNLPLPTDNSERLIQYTRWFGVGTFMLAFSIIIVLIVGK